VNSGASATGEALEWTSSATPSTPLTHIAIQERLDGQVVDWMEKASDEQYQAR
jgi:hypothetical protein